MFLDNKYTKWYYKIIEHRRHNVFDGYTERHHIVPRSLKGSDDPDNLVNLSAREHFICHLLLRNMTIDNDRVKMTLAVGAMMMINGTDRYICNSHTYRIYKEIFASTQSAFMKEQWSDEKFRTVRTKKFREQWKDPEYRLRRTERLKEIWHDPVLSAKRRDAWEKSEKAKLNSEKSKELNRELWKNPEHRQLRVTQQREWANKMTTCAVCGKSVKNAVHSRSHGKRCRYSKNQSLEDFFA